VEYLTCHEGATLSERAPKRVRGHTMVSVKFLLEKFGNPIEGLLRVASYDVDDLALFLQCSRHDAWIEKRLLLALAALYVVSKMPQGMVLAPLTRLTGFNFAQRRRPRSRPRQRSSSTAKSRSTKPARQWSRPSRDSPGAICSDRVRARAKAADARERGGWFGLAAVEMPNRRIRFQVINFIRTAIENGADRRGRSWVANCSFSDYFTNSGIGTSHDHSGFREGLCTMPRTILPTVPRPATQDGNKLGRHAPGRNTNALLGREREYLTPGEVDRLVKTARGRGRYGQRDGLAILMAFRHGLRVSELAGLKWSQIDFATQRLTVHRLKGSLDATHPIAGDELRELRKLARRQETGTRFLFMTERGAPVSVAWFQRMLSRVGAECGLPLVHPHMLRHAAGFALADKGREVREIQDYLGHRNIQNTVGYTRLAPSQFDAIWD
jgi:hypothetical protein